MNPLLRNPLRHCLFFLVVPCALSGQIIPLKTVPIASSDQFLLNPSRRLGMGGVSISLEDALADAFANPARAARLRTAQVFAAPTFYSMSDGMGAGGTLAAGAVVPARNWFVGGAIALQQLRDPNNGRIFVTPPLGGFPSVDRIAEGAPNNTYVHALGGLKLGTTSFGVGVFHASLGGIDGIQQLYGNSWDIAQDGSMTDMRAAMLHETASAQRFEALVVHNRLRMTHDVMYVNWRFDPLSGPQFASTRRETNHDRTNTFGLQFRWSRPLPDSSWRISTHVAGNRKSHPKIPNYDLVAIPRDPGNSTAGEIGLGLARTEGGRTFAMDIVFQPARSHTWAQAGSDTAITGGGTIPAGGTTLENWFRFANLALAIGYDHSYDSGGWQLGIATRSYNQRLRQVNWVQGTTRHVHESWMEWTPTWGAYVKMSGVELRYSGRLLFKGFPQLFGGTAVMDAAPPDVLVAPTQPVFLPDYHVFTNQFSVVIPIGRAR